jgi:hypothetical protein
MFHKVSSTFSFEKEIFHILELTGVQPSRLKRNLLGVSLNETFSKPSLSSLSLSSCSDNLSPRREKGRAPGRVGGGPGRGTGRESGQGFPVSWGRVRRRKSRVTSTKHSPTGSGPRCLNALLLLPAPESEPQQRAEA